MSDTHLTFRGKALDPWIAILDIALVLLIVRILILLISPFNLGPDEAQYWSWSMEPRRRWRPLASTSEAQEARRWLTPKVMNCAAP